MKTKQKRKACKWLNLQYIGMILNFISIVIFLGVFSLSCDANASEKTKLRFQVDGSSSTNHRNPLTIYFGGSIFIVNEKLYFRDSNFTGGKVLRINGNNCYNLNLKAEDAAAWKNYNHSSIRFCSLAKMSKNKTVTLSVDAKTKSDWHAYANEPAGRRDARTSYKVQIYNSGERCSVKVISYSESWEGVDGAKHGKYHVDRWRIKHTSCEIAHDS